MGVYSSLRCLWMYILSRVNLVHVWGKYILNGPMVGIGKRWAGAARLKTELFLKKELKCYKKSCYWKGIGYMGV